MDSKDSLAYHRWHGVLDLDRVRRSEKAACFVMKSSFLLRPFPDEILVVAALDVRGKGALVVNLNGSRPSTPSLK